LFDPSDDPAPPLDDDVSNWAGDPPFEEPDVLPPPPLELPPIPDRWSEEPPPPPPPPSPPFEASAKRPGLAFLKEYGVPLGAMRSGSRRPCAFPSSMDPDDGDVGFSGVGRPREYRLPGKL